MSTTIARKGGREQLEQSNMRLALNMGKMAKEGFSHAAIEETKYLIKKPRAEVWEEMKRDVDFPEHKKVKAAIQRHPAMLHQNQMSNCLRCQSGTAKNPQTRWTRKGTAAPLPARPRERIPQLTPPPPGTPPAQTGNTSGAQPAEIINFPTEYGYSHTALPWAEYFQDDKETEHDTNFEADMLTEEG